MKVRKKIFISGFVQGVGFRPFVYNLAQKYKVAGFVRNTTEGVEIEAEQCCKNLNSFLKEIREKLPPLAKIIRFEVRNSSILNEISFNIVESKHLTAGKIFIPPDVSVCSDCLDELRDLNDKRFAYPFINCTNCGPRYSVIKSLPYDRKNTTMTEFKLCGYCLSEYKNPENRRFHAEPVACPSCGPEIWIDDNKGERIESKDVIKDCTRYLKEGKVIAIKGIGGFHLAVDAENNEAVMLLRERKGRGNKPFAIMAFSMKQIKKIASITKKDIKLLTSHQRPVVLLKKKNNGTLSDFVAPDNNFIGVMLPYTPLHFLVLKEFSGLLVMTSGNYSEEPLIGENETAVEKMSHIADYFLMHNRKIEHNIDDSVVKSYAGKTMFTRRSRGYVPEPLPINSGKTIFAAGADLKNTFAIAYKNYAYIGPHTGDLKNYPSMENYKKEVTAFQKMITGEIEVTAYDMHPSYFSSVFAKRMGCDENIEVQHHHAHIASVMCEHGIDRSVIGIALDGTGYGSDGAVWGGEFLISDLSGFKRKGHLEYIPLFGGEKAIEYPWRMGLSYLYTIYGEDVLNLELDFIKKIDRVFLENSVKALSNNNLYPSTSSCGRLFDAVSSLLGFNRKVTFEGEAAISLEFSSKKCSGFDYSFTIREENDKLIIGSKPVFEKIVKDLQRGVISAYIGYKFHAALVNLIRDISCRIREEEGINEVVLGGGVFQNNILFNRSVNMLKKENFKVYYPCLVPLNDGGISLGQAAIARKLTN